MCAKITSLQAQNLAKTWYGIDGSCIELPGDVDQNFKLTTASELHYLLKFSSEEISDTFLEFQNALSSHCLSKGLSIDVSEVKKNKEGDHVSIITSEGKKLRFRLLTWVPGRLWANLNPKTPALRVDLGQKAGAITKALEDFKHKEAHRNFDWNLADAQWTNGHINLFAGQEKELVQHFQTAFSNIQDRYAQLPKSVVHNDCNDHNIVVTEDLIHPKISGIIDFGDAVYTQTVNDLAITIAYAIMEVPDPLAAANDVVSGYATSYALNNEELSCLYILIAMRLVTTVTKAALRKREVSSTAYHTISEQPAWDALKKWFEVDDEFATYSFRQAAGLTAHPNEKEFNAWALKQQVQFSELFPNQGKEAIELLNLKPSSGWIGSRTSFNNLALFDFKIEQLQKENPTKLIAGGYCEPRPLYTATSYDKEGNSGPESRTVHLGIDFWLPAGTPVHTIFDGEVFTATIDAGYKEYGGLIILKHCEENRVFYTLYGHLSEASAEHFKVGDQIKNGECIGYLGTAEENGAWSPHLHFQLMLSMLDYKFDFPGVTYVDQLAVWKSLCPDPNLLFKNADLITQYDKKPEELLSFRKEHLGKSLSVSYQEPLQIVRGDGVYLIDSFGRKYLDTVNNVNHVGHQHPDVVEAGQQQMSVLNTNTRYLNEQIISLTQELLKTLPPSLNVLHFVNSGSEANELALRMVKAYTGQKDIIASEAGYHGNSNMCVDISSYKFDGKGGSGAPEHTHIIPLPDCFRGKYRGANTGKKYAEEVQACIEAIEKKDRKLAAFIIEPIISCGGQIVLPKNFLAEAYKKVRAAGGLCISDEVQTGCGRMGNHFWGFQVHDVIPDIVTIGKPLGNGHPIAAVACTQEVADSFANGMEYFNTFGGNPVSCAIATAVLQTVKKEKLQENATLVGSYLLSELQQLATIYSIIGDVRGHGLFLGFEIVDADLQPLPNHASYLANRMKDYKILMSVDGPDYNVLKIKPPMIFSLEHAKELISRLQKVLVEDFMRAY